MAENAAQIRAQQLDYAARLAPCNHKGICGTAEQADTRRLLTTKVKQLAQLVRKAEHIVVHTGAGVSTSCGIPDFRGPKGVWTLEKQEEAAQRKRKRSNAPVLKREKAEVKWADAKPTATHMCLVGLHQAGKLQYTISQNVDGLHLRSGIPRDRLAELHGNLFMEICESCSKEIMHPEDLGGVGFKPTGRKCECGGIFRDFVLDWDDALPEIDLELSQQHSNEADLAICLGTSMQMEPASLLPLDTIRNGKAGKLVIINLQPTVKDEYAHLVIRGDLDKVMVQLMEELGLQVPEYKQAAPGAVVIRQGNVAAAGGETRMAGKSQHALEQEADEPVPEPDEQKRQRQAEEQL